jgi:hypothetical protein
MKDDQQKQSLLDYQMELMLREQQHRKRLMMARAEQEQFLNEKHVAPPDTSRTKNIHSSTGATRSCCPIASCTTNALRSASYGIIAPERTINDTTAIYYATDVSIARQSHNDAR